MAERDGVGDGVWDGDGEVDGEVGGDGDGNGDGDGDERRRTRGPALKELTADRDESEFAATDLELDEVRVRGTDGRPVHSKYSVQVKRRARVLWVVLGSLAEVDKALALPAGLTKMWKSQRAPDGADWDEFREQLDIADVDRVDLALGPPGTIALHDQFMRHGRRLLAIAMTALDQGKVFDAEGNEIKQLYDEAGKPIMMGMRPQNVSQLVKVVEVADKIVRSHATALEDMHSAHQGQLREQGALYRHLRSEFEEIIRRVLGVAAWEKLDEALSSGALIPQMRGEGPTVLDQVSGLGQDEDYAAAEDDAADDDADYADADDEDDDDEADADDDDD